jgi:hypothetical protein
MYDKLTEIENLLTNNNVNEALNKITLLKEEINPNKNNINSSNEEIVKKEDVDQKIKEFQEKDILNEPIIFEFVKENYDKYMKDQERINRLNSFEFNPNQDIKPQSLMPDFIKKQLGNM